MDNTRGQATFGDLHLSQQAIFTVEKQHDEQFPFAISQTPTKVLIDLLRMAISAAGTQRLLLKTASYLEYRLQFRRLGRSDPFDRLQFGQ